jgi:hypothetical protein
MRKDEGGQVWRWCINALRGVLLASIAATLFSACAAQTAPNAVASLVITASPALTDRLIADALRDLGWYRDDAGAIHTVDGATLLIELEERQGSTVIHVASPPGGCAGERLFAALRKQLEK